MQVYVKLNQNLFTEIVIVLKLEKKLKYLYDQNGDVGSKIWI